VITSVNDLALPHADAQRPLIRAAIEISVAAISIRGRVERKTQLLGDLFPTDGFAQNGD
jgi:hypothetical protein